MENKKSNHLAANIICGILTIFGIVACIISILSGSEGIWFVTDCGCLILFLLIFYYALLGYKKPHGNLLKYIILLYAVIFLLSIMVMVNIGNTNGIVSRVVEIGILCYIAGRLVKVKENLFLMIIVTICRIIALISNINLKIATIGVVIPLILWLDICFAYFLRYKEHKEASLTDKK